MTALGFTNIDKGTQDMISANTKGSVHFKQSQTNSVKAKPANRNKIGTNTESTINQKLQPERSVGKKKKKDFKGICLAITRCHESKTNSEARFDHKCVSSLVVKALDLENTEQANLSEA